jgi:two-component system CheB/CheR fusion protein
MTRRPTWHKIGQQGLEKPLATKSAGGKPRRRAGQKDVDVLVGIAVARASYASLQAIAAKLPADSGAAFIVVYSHSQGLVAQTVADDLATLSGLPAEVCTAAVRPRPNQIYVAPGACFLLSVDGELVPEAPHDPGAKRGSIDSLMTSLAENLQACAIGVFLQDIAPDGVAGIKTLKEHGGFALGEAPEHPSRGLSEAVDPDGIMDLLLPAEEMPPRIAAYIEHLRASGAAANAAPSAALQQNLGRIAAILRNKTGHDFHGYKQNTFARRVQRRMQVLQLDTMEGYLSALHADPAEVDHLFQDLLIGVTQFFRDGPEFGLLEREVIPKLFEGKTASDQVRVWVLGCATGEEAYSIGILLREHMATLDVVPAVQIFATDLDGRALSMARSGRYPESISKDLTAERLERWFTHEGATYSVVKELREMCIFSQHNVVRDAPFSRIDLVSCRNLLIYLTGELQDRVIPLFHFSLKPGGYLFLGPSENVTRHVKLFAPIERRHRIFRRLEAVARLLPEFPLTTAKVRAAAPGQRTVTRRQQVNPAARKTVERIIERYAPTYVLIDNQFDVLQFSERTGAYLEPIAGSATLNLLNLVRRELRVDLRAALHTAAADRRRVQVDAADISINGVARRHELIIEPISEDDYPTGFLVMFRDNGAAASLAALEANDAALLRDEHVQRLEAELRHSNERLQATIEELESTNEELKSSNEEYQSINEEMQSANEELETSKEELQSVNEELHTVNGELGYRVSELARANSDLKNLLENTQIATIFLDNDLRVKSFTPSVGDVYHLIDTDLGRPITDIASRIDYPELRDDVRRVLRTLAPVEREVRGQEAGAHYLLRVLPYRSIDNFIAGAVITFADVSDLVRAQAALSESEARYRMVVESATDYAIITMDEQRRITGWNPGAANVFGASEDEMIGKPADEIFTPEDRAQDAPEGEAVTALRRGSAADNRWHLRSDGARFWASGVLMPLKPPMQGFVKILHDRTQERENEERQRLLMAELQHRVKNILAVVRSIASRTLENTDDLEDFSAHFDGRLQALARTQNVLTRTGSGKIDLEELVSEELLTHEPHNDGQVTIEGPQIDLKDRAAEIFALALHELATNAVKYGALAHPRGHITVSWRVLRTAAGGRLSLEWRESGVPALNPSPTRHGFGRDLIERGLPYELGAATSLEFLPGGVRCTIELPIDPQGSADSESLQWNTQG